jgi:Domain of unknown function (DUF4105)
MRRSRHGWPWWLGFVLFLLMVAVVGAIVTLALHFQSHPARLWIFLWLAALFAALALALGRGLTAGLLIIAAAAGVAAVWWSTIAPTNDRAWQPDVAELLSGAPDPADPDLMTLRNVRDFHWITTTEFEPRWETRTYDLATLDTTEVVLTYWAGPAIAHTMVSFGFENGEHVVFSVGIRPAEGEAYSSLAGFFKVYELIVTAADERDAIGLRTSVQTGNSVHLYRLAMPRETARSLFLEYVALANDLVETPRFYRTILANCTTIVWGLVRRLDPGVPLDWRVLLPGYLPAYLYERQSLDMRFTLPELEAMSRLPADIPTTLDSRAYSMALRTGAGLHRPRT